MARVARRHAAGAEGTGFKSRTDQISARCQRFATAATLKCEPRRKASKIGTAHYAWFISV